MKEMLRALKSVANKYFVLVSLGIASVLVIASDVLAQTLPVPFTQRNTWAGPFDIKMIAAPNLDPVFVNPSAGAGNLLADSLIRYEVIQRTGDLLHINNQYKGGSPFKTVSSIPKSAFLCGNPEIGGCVKGLLTTTPNSTCALPTIKYNGPDYVSRIVSMSYADYDNDMTTFSSSMAQLSIPSCSEIEAAYLYWTGDWITTNPAITLMDGPLNTFNGVNASTVFSTSPTSGYGTIKFKIPGGSYQDVTSTTNYTGPNTYVCVADVTSLVQGTSSGQFWAANIQSYPNEGNGGSTSGWTMVVVFRSPLSPPRSLYLWDGFLNISQNNSTSIVISGLTAPSTSNFNSYVGFAALDGENLAVELDGTGQEGLGFQTDAGGTLQDINPFATDQPHYRMYNKKGYPAMCDGSDDIDGCKKPLYDASWCSSYDGVSSSHITTYNEVTGKNGNEIVRLPSNKNTLGFDAHHMKLPAGAVAPNATSATLTVKAGPQGGTLPYMAYIAIESVQPKLVMTKTSDTSATALNAPITYKLKIKNMGNAASLGNDTIIDTLDVATDYVASSLVSTPSGALLYSSAGDNLVITIPQSIPVGDSVEVSFTVNVKPYVGNENLYNSPSCKRTITNTAYVKYNTVNSGILQSKSNANDCGIGSETSVLIFDAILSSSTATPLGPFSVCSMAADSVLKDVRARLLTAGIAPSDISKYDIRDSSYVKVRPEKLFGSITNGSVIYYAIRDFNSAGNCQEIYSLTYSCNTCTPPVITSLATGKICSGVPQNYDITSDLAGTTYSWNRAAVANISNPAVTGRTTNPIRDTLINIGTTPKVVRYVITPTAAGCTGTAFNYDVTVNPNAAPVAVNDTVSLCLKNNEEINIDVTANDTDDDSIKVTKVFSSSGPMSILNDSTIKFSSNLSSSGAVSVSYVICDKDVECPKCDTATISLCVEVTEVFIPNLVTPGNDSHNNTFQITGLFPNTTLKVYNTWGTLVFLSENYKNDWNPSGNADGIYYYFLKDSTRQKEWKGWIQVISDSK